MDRDDDRAPGWDAIDGALRAVYGDQEPKHYGTILPFMFGGPDPLDGISVYKRSDPPHWHYVSYGLTELYAKEGEDATVSGFGFELTFRLSCDAGADEPPHWPMSFMQNLARYVFRSGNVFAAGHHMTLNGPIALEAKTDLTAALFVADPDLAEIDTPNGKMSFVQIIGITGDELEAVQAWNSDGLTEILRSASPRLVTSLERASVLRDERIAATVAERTEREGRR